MYVQACAVCSDSLGGWGGWGGEVREEEKRRDETRFTTWILATWESTATVNHWYDLQSQTSRRRLTQEDRKKVSIGLLLAVEQARIIH